MILQLKEIFSVTGESKLFEYEIEAEKLSEYSQYAFKTPITIKGSVVNRAGIVTLSFACVFTIEHNCDRCLCEFAREYELEFEHTLVRKAQFDEDYVECPDNTLDLDELAICDLLLEIPVKILCREDCKGLCYKCGADLNVEECRCSDEQ